MDAKSFKILETFIKKSGTRGPGSYCTHCCRLPKGSPSKFVKSGTFIRSVDKATIQRYRCADCGKTYSDATNSPDYKQIRRDINLPAFLQLSSAGTLRRTAILLNVSRGTLHRRLPFFKIVSKQAHRYLLQDVTGQSTGFAAIQFDDMETFEHTKLKPLAVPLVVISKERFILGVGVGSMPAKGKLAERSRKKYGQRPDHRPEAWREVLTTARAFVNQSELEIITDKHVSYPKAIKEVIPWAHHIRKKSRRACVVGQGELKKGGFDPMFPLNHTAAMNRANISRLVRRTWCTTKRPDRLLCHLWLYVLWHNVTIWTVIRHKNASSGANQATSVIV
jgi:transposase-like protein